MKNFLKPVLIILFSVSFFYAPAQNVPGDTTEGKISDVINRMLQHMMDSLKITQLPLDESNEILNAENNDFKEINTGKSFLEAVILGDADIILTNGPEGKVKLEGGAYDLEHTKVNVEGDKLVISRKNKTRSKLRISMSSANLTTLVIDGDSKVFSEGVIRAKSLEIILGGTSMVSLRYNGKLNVLAGNQSELIDIAEYQKIAIRQ